MDFPSEKYPGHTHFECAVPSVGSENISQFVRPYSEVKPLAIFFLRCVATFTPTRIVMCVINRMNNQR